MMRLVAFALHADERLEFGRGLSTDDEPDLWRKSLTGEIEQWIGTRPARRTAYPQGVRARAPSRP